MCWIFAASRERAGGAGSSRVFLPNPALFLLRLANEGDKVAANAAAGTQELFPGFTSRRLPPPPFSCRNASYLHKCGLNGSGRFRKLSRSLARYPTTIWPMCGFVPAHVMVAHQRASRLEQESPALRVHLIKRRIEIDGESKMSH